MAEENIQKRSKGGGLSPKSSWVAVPIALALLASACGLSAEAVNTGTGADDPATADEISEPDGSTEPDSTDEVIDDGGGPVNIDVELLTAGTWTLMFGGGPDGEVPLVDGYPITITFDGDGSFGGTAACNGYGGTYDVDGPQIFFGEIAWTEMGCEPGVQASEGAFLAALLDSVDVNVTSEELALSGPSSELMFVPGAADDNPIEAVVDAPDAVEGDLRSSVSATQWHFTGGDGPDGEIVDPRTIDSEALISLFLADGEYDGDGACNRYGGSSQLPEDLSSLTLSVPEGTEEGCGGGVDAIVNAYLSALPQLTDVSLTSSGELVLTGNGYELRFDPVV